MWQAADNLNGAPRQLGLGITTGSEASFFSEFELRFNSKKNYI